MIEQIKKLAGECLSEKWECVGKNVYISSKCAFCYDTIEDIHLLRKIRCEVCKIPSKICNGVSTTSLIEIIQFYAGKNGYMYLDEITYFNSYKLMIRCLRDLEENGVISIENLEELNEMILNYEKKMIGNV